jgi:protein-disulfide isomerase
MAAAKEAPRAAALVALVGLVALAGVASDAVAQSEDSDRVQMHLQPDEESQGSPTAPITVVEFTDYQCPYCRRFQAETWPQLKKNYVDTGKVRFIVRDLPLDFHPAARPAAQAAHCAAEQHKFWPMHEALLGGPADLLAGGIDRRAHAVGLDLVRLHACVASGKYSFAIARNGSEADALGLNGTPSFVIGRVANGVLTGERVAGALPYSQFDAGLKELLAGD